MIITQPFTILQSLKDTVFPKNILHGGAKYPRISCTGVPKRGDVIITVTPEQIRCDTVPTMMQLSTCNV